MTTHLKVLPSDSLRGSKPSVKGAVTPASSSRSAMEDMLHEAHTDRQARQGEAGRIWSG